MSLVVYHWTTREAADKILQEGFTTTHIYVCRQPEDWHGEVCLALTMREETDWENCNKSDWQRCLCSGERPIAIREMLKEKP